VFEQMTYLDHPTWNEWDYVAKITAASQIGHRWWYAATEQIILAQVSQTTDTTAAPLYQDHPYARTFVLPGGAGSLLLTEINNRQLVVGDLVRVRYKSDTPQGTVYEAEAAGSASGGGAPWPLSSGQTIVATSGNVSWQEPYPTTWQVLWASLYGAGNYGVVLPVSGTYLVMANLYGNCIVYPPTNTSSITMSVSAECCMWDLAGAVPIGPTPIFAYAQILSQWTTAAPLIHDGRNLAVSLSGLITTTGSKTVTVAIGDFVSTNPTPVAGNGTSSITVDYTSTMTYVQIG
jgi:hypothetical protein